MKRGETPLGLGASSPWELPPEALTEPDVKLSPHPALIIQSSFKPLGYVVRFCPIHRFPPIAGCFNQPDRMIAPLRSTPITGDSSLLRAHPSLCPASVLSPCGFSLVIRTTGSPVPQSSLYCVHALSMPVAAPSVLQFTPALIPNLSST